ncbi:MAG: MATE family efflux transporter [Clostridia bacterium]|nr:MATE family efflux transporter [Clostridia bacterium]
MQLRRKKSFELDMTHGRLIPKVMVFALPLMLTSMLQLLYNAADVVVVGRFAGPESLAAVGSTGALINLIVNVFLGLSVGTNVLVARDYGAGDRKGTYETVHTSVLVGLIGGVALGIFGFIMGGTFLKWMGSPKEVLPLATKYIQIYFIGMPFNMLYNFGAAILRAVGDTKRPLIFLSFSGLINVALNLLFVIKFHMGVRGVAWATIISQAVSAALVLICLIRDHGFVHLDLRKLHINMKKLGGMLKIGLPAGFQGACFSISNVLIQSTINSHGAIVVAGNSAASNIEGFIYVAMNAFHQAVISFVSTNIGAGKYSRIGKSMGACLMLAAVVGVVMGGLVCLFRIPLLRIYSPDDPVIQAGLRRLMIIASTYFICGLMDVLCGVLRGMGASLAPMIVSVLGVCAFRIFWIYVILPINTNPDLELTILYISYPVSWIITGAVHFICCLSKIRKYPGDVPEYAGNHA